MDNIKITPKLVGRGAFTSLHIPTNETEWFSNGAWAVRKSHVTYPTEKQEAVLRKRFTVKDTPMMVDRSLEHQIDGVLNDSRFRPWVVMPRLWGSTDETNLRYGRVFEEKKPGQKDRRLLETVLIDEKIWIGFGHPRTIWGCTYKMAFFIADEKPTTVDEVVAVVMPLLNP